MSITGPPEGEPVKVGVPLTDVLTGLYSFGAVSSALYQRQQTGKAKGSPSPFGHAARDPHQHRLQLPGGEVIPRRWAAPIPTSSPMRPTGPRMPI